MKLLHILFSGLGGHGNVFFSMYAADTNKEFQFGAIFNGIEDLRAEYKDRCEAEGIEYYYVKKRPGRHIEFYKKIRQAIISAKPDIIFLHGSMAVSVAWLAKLQLKKRPKIVVRETQAMHMKTFAEKSFLKLSMLLADHVVFLSEQYQASVKKSLGKLYKASKVSVIPNGIELNVFSPALKNRSGLIQLGMQSRIVSIKDHLSLVRSMADLVYGKGISGIHLSIAGDGEFRSVVEKEVEDLNLRDYISFMGMLNESELPGFLQSLDIYIHASFGETMSTAIMQAMACGLPIIASDVQGINNMVHEGKNGTLVPVQDPEAISNKVTSLINDPLKSGLLGSAAREYASKHFSNKAMLESYKKLFY